MIESAPGDRAIAEAVRAWLTQDEEGRALLERIDSGAADAGAELPLSLRARAGQAPPQIATIVHDGHVDKIINILNPGVVTTPDEARDVSGLPNPYLGLRAFTYHDRERFTGRSDAVREAVTLLTGGGDMQAARPLLFVTGASGSGKSSFAQAGLLPALEAYYGARKERGARGERTAWAVFRPGKRPLAALADALLQLGLPRPLALDPQGTIGTASAFAETMLTLAPQGQTSLLVLDQAEELFTQADPSERDALIAILSALPSFAALRTHVVATLRSDYLGELFHHPTLYELATKQGLALREMAVEDLQAAIERPLQAVAGGDERYRGKSWEPGLVEKLALQAAPSAAYLPLLQLTLTELWRRGRLTLGAYADLGDTMTDALEERATAVLEFADHDRSRPHEARSAADREAILRLFLDLVQVSVEGDDRPHVRRRRARAELELERDASGATGTARARLIDDLAGARLLSLQEEGGANYVDLIHESLIANWERLRQAVAAERQSLQRRGRFELAVGRWEANGRADDYLLDGVDLAEARALRERGDIALRGEAARALFDRSEAREKAERERQLQTQRRVIMGLGALAAGLLVAAVFAGWKTLESEDKTRLATSRQLAALAVSQFPVRPEVALLLSVEALRSESTREARGATLQLRANNPYLGAFLAGHQGEVQAVASNPARGLFATGGRDGVIRLWDAAGRRLHGELPGHSLAAESDQRPVRALAFNREGTLLASGGADETVRLWDVATLKPIEQPLKGQTNEVLSVAFSPDGTLLASGSSDHSVVVWDVRTRERRFDLRDEGRAGWGWIESLAFHPDPQRQLLAAGTHNRMVVLWDLAAAATAPAPAPKLINAHSGEVRAVAFHPNGDLLASGGGDRTIQVWNVASGAPIGVPVTGHTGWVEALAFAPDGLLASAGRDGRIVLWHVPVTPGHAPPAAAARQVDALRGHTDTVRGLAFGRDGTLLASGGTDSRVMLWDVRAGLPLAGHERDQDQSPGVESVAFSPDGKLLASGAHDRTVRLWNPTQRTPAAPPLRDHGDEVRAVAFNRDGTVIAAASGGGDPRIWLWDAKGQQMLREPLGTRGRPANAHEKSVRRLAFSPTNRDLLASSSEDGTIRLWNVATGEPAGDPLRGHGDPLSGGARAVESVAFSPDGKLLVSGGEDKTIRLWDAGTRQQVGELRGHTGRVWSVAFSPDGRTLASAGADRTVRLWEVATRQPRGAPLEGHTGEVRRVAFSPDGRTLASASTGGTDWTIWLWDVASRLPLGQPLTGHTGEIWDVAFADGRTLASASRDLTVRLWNVDLDPDSWRRQVCGTVGRNLTAEEWRQYVGEGSPRATCPDLPLPLPPAPAPSASAVAGAVAQRTPAP